MRKQLIDNINAVVAVAGFGALEVGVAEVSRPGAWMVGGALLLLWACWPYAWRSASLLKKKA